MFNLIELINTNDEYHQISYLIVLHLFIICCILKMPIMHTRVPVIKMLIGLNQ